MGNLLGKLITAAAKIAAEEAAKSLRQKAETEKKTKLRTENTVHKRNPDPGLMRELGRSKIFDFRFDEKYGIVLTGCKTQNYPIGKLTVPDVVNCIGSEAFKGCGFLQEIILPDSVTKIERGAFMNCGNLRTVHFPKELKTIGSHAFDNSGITEAVLPAGLYMIGDRAFYNCTSLKTVTLPETLNAFEIGVFYGCEALEEVLMPMDMRGTVCNLFAHCKSLKRVDLPRGIETIGDWTFEYCDSLEQVWIPGTVKKICNRAFLFCRSLEEIYIPDSVKEIEIGAVFAGCTALKKVRLPIGIRFQPKYNKEFDKVFYGCGALKTVVLGSDVFEVDEPPDENALLKMHLELAVDGNPTAKAYVRKNLPAVLSVLIAGKDTALTDRLLSSGLITPETVEAADFDSAVDLAAVSDAGEIYVMLVQYKNEIFGYGGQENRFEL